MWTICKVFFEFVTILFLHYAFGFLAKRHVGGLSSLTRDRNCTPCIGRLNLNRWPASEVT